MFLFFCYISMENGAVVLWRNRFISGTLPPMPFENAAMLVGSVTWFSEHAAFACTHSHTCLSLCVSRFKCLSYRSRFEHAVRRPCHLRHHSFCWGLRHWRQERCVWLSLKYLESWLFWLRSADNQLYRRWRDLKLIIVITKGLRIATLGAYTK